jgi:fused signal recognition particle receptor
VVGVNGSGKTTTIGKLAALFSANGHIVLLAAGDTFRAAAIEQLKIWGERLGCPVVSREQGADASALAIFGRVAGVTGLVMTKFDGNDLAREVEKW